jgi:hypothetical protein
MKEYGEWRNNSTAILAPVISSPELYIFPMKVPPEITAQEAVLTSQHVWTLWKNAVTRTATLDQTPDSSVVQRLTQ